MRAKTMVILHHFWTRYFVTLAACGHPSIIHCSTSSHRKEKWKEKERTEWNDCRYVTYITDRLKASTSLIVEILWGNIDDRSVYRKLKPRQKHDYFAVKIVTVEASLSNGSHTTLPHDGFSFLVILIREVTYGRSTSM